MADTVGLSFQFPLPDAAVSQHAATSDDVPLESPRELGDLLWARYKAGKSSDASILDKSIQATQIAVNLEHMSDDHAQLLSDLGMRLKTRFKLNYALEDLNGAISAFQRAVEVTSDEDSSQMVRLNRLGVALFQHFDRMGKLDELNAAITAFSCAVELTPDAHPQKPSFLSNCGASFLRRFERAGDLEDIERAIAILRRADELVSDDHSDKQQCSTTLGNSLVRRFEATGKLEDLEQAILSHRRAVELTPDDHPNKPFLFNNLGTSLLTRFERTGEFDDIEQAISTYQRAVELTPDRHPENIKDKPVRLCNLGNAFLDRFRRTGELNDLEEAISLHIRAVELTPDDHPDKPSWLHNLGCSFHDRFERIGELEVLEQAISAHRRAVELTPCNHPEKPSRLSNLGGSYLLRFKRTGELQDLEQAVSAHHRAVELTPDRRPNKPSRLSSLGMSLLARFECTGDLEDVEQSITAHLRAVELTPDRHPDLPSRLSNLGSSFRRRFDRTEEFEDLKQAISLHRRAVELTPDGHPDKPMWLNNLGNSLSSLGGTSDDLEEAISFYRRAIELTADDHPRKPMWLSHLCQELSDRFRRTKEPEDITSAISAGQRAIHLSPEGHPNLVQCYDALAGCFQYRFDYYSDIDDINQAVYLLKNAVELINIADGDWRLSTCLFNLSGAQARLFKRTQTKMDFDAIVESCTKSALHASGDPFLRLRSATRCARILSDHPSFATADSLLSAHSHIIAILPEIVWLGYDIHRRYEESSQLDELVHAAVAAAVTAGRFGQAVEWLEAGRALIWSQILALRTPLDELQDSHPELAKSLRTVQQQLKSSTHSTFARDDDAFGGVDGPEVMSAADRLRGLAIKYDKLMKSIRACPGFEDFLRPKRLESLVPSPGLMSGHVIFINVHSSRCDAIVISPSGVTTAIPLLDLSLKRATELQRLWTEHVMDGRASAQRPLGSVGDIEGELNPLKYYLKHTWTWIVQPILEALDLAKLTQNDRLPYIIWCPTGPLMQLPLHAAGIYDEPDGPRVYDFVVSSYIPTLSALARGIHAVAEPYATRGVLIVTQPSTPDHTPLPGTVLEGNRLRDTLAASGITSKWLNNEFATLHEVRIIMKEYPWIHLACHGSQNREDATQSAFHLYDGPLTLTDLMGTAADNAELAFLSACQTAVGDKEVPEESAHLAAGMLAVGFKGVIATMWSIQDADAPIVVEAYYKELLALRSSGTLGKGETGAAYALHEATRVLRETAGETSFMRWVPFVHFGI
ncbi:TPR-like protein [Peniophora sp. CONT]|nr:TPR-like protein [Peniophora sp. CONT]